MNKYTVLIFAVIIIGYLIELTVELLNLSRLDPVLPREFEETFDQEHYHRSQKYTKVKTRFGLIQNAVSAAVLILFIFSGGFSFVDNIARAVSSNDIAAGLIFAVIFLFFSQLLSLPFSFYNTFVIEEKFGFNRTDVRTFYMDAIKTFVLSVVFGCPILAAIIYFFQSTGAAAWLYCWAALIVYEIFVLFIAPVVIMPLFNRFEPLEDQELKKLIEDYARKQNFALGGIYQMDGSKRSSKSNAFFTGFGRFRKIALFDTLINNHSKNELLAILAHEIGHYKFRHIFIMMAVSVVTNGIMFYLLSFFMNNRLLFEAFKMNNVSIYASLLLFSFIYMPLNALFSIFLHWLSRKNEYQADCFAVESTGHKNIFINALKKLSTDNMSNLTPHPLKVFLEYTHPPVLARIRAINELEIEK